MICSWDIRDLWPATHQISIYFTSKCMHGMNQTEAEYSRHGKRSQRASLSQIGPVVLEVITRYLLRMRTIGHVT